MAICLGRTLPHGSSGVPGTFGRAALKRSPIRPCSGWGLHGRRIAAAPVRSYRTISPLPAETGGMFLLHFPSPRDAPPLAGTLPCGVRTFLSPPKREAATRSAGNPVYRVNAPDLMRRGRAACF